jgi:gamma-glutamyltranspeptidase/glutathione hydrolase
MTKGKGVVAAGHELTARAAAEILQDGGNAFDAALAGIFMTFVAEAVFASPGGGGFFMARRAKDFLLPSSRPICSPSLLRS